MGYPLSVAKTPQPPAIPLVLRLGGQLSFTTSSLHPGLHQTWENLAERVSGQMGKAFLCGTERMNDLTSTATYLLLTDILCLSSEWCLSILSLQVLAFAGLGLHSSQVYLQPLSYQSGSPCSLRTIPETSVIATFPLVPYSTYYRTIDQRCLDMWQAVNSNEIFEDDNRYFYEALAVYLALF